MRLARVGASGGRGERARIHSRGSPRVSLPGLSALPLSSRGSALLKDPVPCGQRMPEPTRAARAHQHARGRRGGRGANKDLRGGTRVGALRRGSGREVLREKLFPPSSRLLLLSLHFPLLLLHLAHEPLPGFAQPLLLLFLRPCLLLLLLLPLRLHPILRAGRLQRVSTCSAVRAHHHRASPVAHPRHACPRSWRVGLAARGWGLADYAVGAVTAVRRLLVRVAAVRGRVT